MAFHETVFPTDISYGSKGGPGFNTAVVETSSGHEERVGRWESARRTYDVAWGLKTLDNLARLQVFFQARKGALYGFRYKDPLDCTSADNGRDAPTNLDQVIGQGDNVVKQYQLRKTYTEGPSEGVSTITKPIAGTVLIALAGVAQTEGVDFTVDTTTGIVTFASPPGMGVTITAGFQMHWPCRFGEEADRGLQATIDGFENGNIGPIPVVEIRDELVAATDAYPGGNLDIEALSGADVQLSRAYVSVRVRATDGTTDLLLPDPTLDTGQDIPAGGPHWFIFNHDLANSIEVRDHDANLVATIGPDSGKTIVLGAQANDTAIERWYLNADFIEIPDGGGGTCPAGGGINCYAPWDGGLDFGIRTLTQTIVGEQIVSMSSGAGAAHNIGFLTPPGEPADPLWNDPSGTTVVIDVSAVFGAGVILSQARVYAINAAGSAVIQIGTLPSPSQAFGTATGQRTYVVPSDTWVGVDANTRLAIDFFWQAQFGGVGTTLEIRVGSGTSYVDTSITNAPSLKQWLAF